MANSTQITVLDSASATATVSTLDAFVTGTATMLVGNATASLLNATVVGTTVISGTALVANATASLLNATVTGTILNSIQTSIVAATIATGSQASPSAAYLSTVAAGDIAAAASDSGNPVKIGAVAQTSNPTAVTSGQRVNLTADKEGRLLSVGAIRTLKLISTTAISTTAETTLVGATSAIFNDLYGFICANSGSTGTLLTLKDSTAGTTRAFLYCPATETRGFMLPVDAALPQATVSTNWTVTLSASTSSANISAFYVQNI